jgi:hypothetical protein
MVAATKGRLKMQKAPILNRREESDANLNLAAEHIEAKNRRAARLEYARTLARQNFARHSGGRWSRDSFASDNR